MLVLKFSVYNYNQMIFQVKTDLLRVYTNDLEDSTPHELKSINVELLTRKITELEEDNRTLHAEASKVGHMEV